MVKIYEEPADARVGIDIEIERLSLMPRHLIPAGTDTRCKTCVFWFGFFDSGWCYCHELYVSGDYQCSDWSIRSSNLISFHDRTVMSHGVEKDDDGEENETESEARHETAREGIDIETDQH